jgi:hypothetical protein
MYQQISWGWETQQRRSESRQLAEWHKVVTELPATSFVFW